MQNYPFKTSLLKYVSTPMFVCRHTWYSLYIATLYLLSIGDISHLLHSHVYTGSSHTCTFINVLIRLTLYANIGNQSDSYFGCLYNVHNNLQCYLPASSGKVVSKKLGFRFHSVSCNACLKKQALDTLGNLVSEYAYKHSDNTTKAASHSVLS